MCISQGVPLGISGGHVFGFVMMIFNLILKLILLVCANKHFGQLGGTWAFSANFSLDDTNTGDSDYVTMSADNNSGSNIDYSGNVSYQEHDYKSPPATAGSATTQHL